MKHTTHPPARAIKAVFLAAVLMTGTTGSPLATYLPMLAARQAAYAACAADLSAEHARWVKDPAPEREIIPASCGAAVSDEDFTRAWRTAGGAVWVAQVST